MHVGTVCVFALAFIAVKVVITHKTTKFFFKFDKDDHAEMHT